MAITPVLITGYEQGLIAASGGGLAGALYPGAGIISIDSSVKKTGARSLKIAAHESTSSTTYVNYAVPSASILVASLDVLWHAWPGFSTTTSEILCTCPSGSDTAVGVDIATHKLAVWGQHDITTRVLSANAAVLDTWYHVDVRFTITGSGEGGTTTIDWYVDGVLQTQYYLGDYGAGSWGVVNVGFHLQSVTLGIMYVDNFVYSNTSGDFPIGRVYIEGKRPNADGTHNNPNVDVIEDGDGNRIDGSTVFAYDHINENPWTGTYGMGGRIQQTAVDGGGRYVEVQFEDTAEGNILGVSAWLEYAASSDTSPANAGCIIRDSNGQETTVWGSPSSTGDYSENYCFYKRAIVVTPSGGWTKDHVNALRARLGFADYTTYYPYWQALMLEVAYGPETISLSGTCGASSAVTGSMKVTRKIKSIFPDIVNESFEATPGYDMGAGWWSTSVGSGSTLDPDSVGHQFSGHGSQCCKVKKVSPNFDSYFYHTFASDQKDVYGEYHFYIESESLATNNQVILITVYDVNWHCRIASYFEKLAGGGLQFHTYSYYDGADHWGTLQNISVGVEYRVRWRYDAANKIVKIWLNDTEILSATPTTFAGGCRYLYCGSADPYATTFYWDGIELSSQGWSEGINAFGTVSGSLTVTAGGGVQPLVGTCDAVSSVSGALKVTKRLDASVSDALTDGGFEYWDSDTNLTYWWEYMGGSSELHKETSIVHAGNYSAKFVMDASQYFRVANPGHLIIPPGASCVLSAWYKQTEANKGWGCRIETADGKYSLQDDGTWSDTLYGNLPIENEGTNWTYYSFPFTALPNYSEYSIYLREYASSTTVYVDEVSLKSPGGIQVIASVTGSMKVARKFKATFVTSYASLSGTLTVTGAGGGYWTPAGTVDGVSSIVGVLRKVRPVAGSSSAVSSITGILKRVKKLTGLVTVSSSVSGISKVKREFVGSFSAVSSISGVSKPAKKFTGLLSAVSSITGIQKRTREFVGISSAVSGVTGLIKCTKKVKGTSDAVSVITGGLATEGRVDLYGTLSAVASISGISKVRKKFVGTSSAVSLVTGVLRRTRKPAGLCAASSSITGVAKRVKRILGTSSAVSSISGVTKRKREFVGISQAVSTITGVLSTQGRVDLYGVVGAVSSASGVLKVRKKFVGAVAGISSVPAIPFIHKTRKFIAVATAAQSTITGKVTPRRKLVGAVSASSLVSGIMKPRKPLKGVVSSVSTVLGIAKVKRKIVGLVSSTSSVLGILHERRKLFGAVTSSSTITGTCKKAIPLRGVVSSVSTVSGLVKRIRRVLGVVASALSIEAYLSSGQEARLRGTVSPVSSISGKWNVHYRLFGTSTAISSITGATKLLVEVSGASAAYSSASALLRGIYPLSGSFAATSSVNGVLQWVFRGHIKRFVRNVPRQFERNVQRQFALIHDDTDRVRIIITNHSEIDNG
jgi:hypothetical protein